MDTAFDTSFEQDEFEEVESPFQKTTKNTRFKRKKQEWDKPFNTAPVDAPIVQEEHETISPSQIEYLNDDGDEEEEKLPATTRPRRPKKVAKKKNTLSQIMWGLVALLVLRMIFMERGVIDYFANRSTIVDKEEELREVQKDNQKLSLEINRMQFDKAYQKQLAKEHLGVIARDEFLILFGSESAQNSN